MTFYMEINELLLTAGQCLETGRFGQAVGLFEAVLEKNPRHQSALYLLGLTHYYNAHYESAKRVLSQALHFNPDQPQLQKILGKVYFALSQFENAWQCFKSVVKLNPADAEGWYELGKIIESQGDLQKAGENYRRAIDLDSSYAPAKYKMALIHYENEEFKKAVLLLQETARLQPQAAAVYNALGLAYYRIGDYNNAQLCLGKAITIQPELVEACNNMGLVLKALGEYGKALEYFRKAVELQTNYAEAYYNAGSVTQKLGRVGTSIAYYNKALSINGKISAAHNNLGILLQYQGKTEDARTCFQRAIQSDCKNYKAYHNLAIVYRIEGQLKPALTCIQKLLSFNPDDYRALVINYEILRDMCDWAESASVSAKLDNFTRLALQSESKPEEGPFLNVTRSNNMAENLSVAKLWSAEIEKTIRIENEKLTLTPNKIRRKLIVGYVSDGFRNHPSTRLISDIFKHHDRSRFSVFCYSYGESDQNGYRRKIEQECDQFIDLQDLDDFAIARRIHNDGCDILVDLKGYTFGSRVKIFGFRPAPIQVRYLGMPGTTGASFFDYLITDETVTPPEFSEFYTEKFAYMPDCYQINSIPLSEKSIFPTREAAGLPPEGFIFCSFCSSYKINRSVFEAWMKILNRVPNSYLWLLKGSREFVENILVEAKLHNVGTTRIFFAERCSWEQHIDRLKFANLALDTDLVSGAATTSDALWAGVPVLTVKGKHFASRMSASILYAVGLDEMICDDLKEYEDVAVDYAQNNKKIFALKSELKKNALKGSLFDAGISTGHLEELYQTMWNHYLNGDPSRLIDLKSSF